MESSQKNDLLNHHTQKLQEILRQKSHLNEELDNQNRQQIQEITQLKRAVNEMQVARQALIKEHQFEIENIEKDWIYKLENQRSE